jgi:hypothetical protein
MKIESDEVTFSSGRKMYANLGIIGLSPDLELSQGYDRSIDWPFPEWRDKDERAPERQIDAQDMRELADYMIAQWTSFRDGLKS